MVTEESSNRSRKANLLKSSRRRHRKRMEHVLRETLINIRNSNMSGLEVALSYAVYGWVGKHYYYMIKGRRLRCV